jgi:hypothetical protein
MLPKLPLDKWESSKNTLHLYLQIVGKVRMALFPRMNHWWHVPLYVSYRGLTTRPIPYDGRMIDISFDFIDHQLHVSCSDDRIESFPLQGQSVASFYQSLMDILTKLGVQVSIIAKPYDLPFSNIPFAEDTEHASYDAEWIKKYWQTMGFVNSTFEVFRGRFVGKSTPVHLFWHHADLALTRFSGKKGPAMEGRSRADQEAYSHEVISFGFWVGDSIVREPAFYTYVYPEPENITDEKLTPDSALWNTDFGYSMAFLPYETVRTAEQPDQVLLAFLQNTYELMANRAGWDIESFKLSE